LDEAHSELYHNILTLIENQKNYNFEIQASTSEIRSVSAELSVTLDENRSFSSELFSSAKTLSELNSISFNNTSQSIEKIRNMVSYLLDIKSSSERAKESNVKTGLEIEEGLSRVYKIIELINNIEQTSKKSVELVEEFTGFTSKISSILKTVDDIAKQTEILAFNATVESRRAGNEGRGFGVIAGAIRDLADKSKHEVSYIEDVVESINEGIKELKENISADYTNVAESVDNTKTIESSFGRIESSYAHVRNVIDEVLTISEAQNRLATEITDDITVIEKNSTQVNSGVDTIYKKLYEQQTSIEGLNRLSRSLLSASGNLSKLSSQSIFEEEYDTDAIQKTSAESVSIMKNEILNRHEIALLKKESYVSAINSAMNKHGIFDTVWANDYKGRFIYSNPPEPEGFTNARDREWFKETILGKEYISPIYISVTNKKPCVTVSLPIYSPDNRIAGVLSADIKLSAPKSI